MVEFPDRVLITNAGDFLPGSVQTVIQQDAPQLSYRNPFLADAMVELNLIDTQGGGIKRMFETQRRRSFPLPDYDLEQVGRRQLRYRKDQSRLALDLCLFINGLPIATFVLKNSLTKQTVADAVEQDKRDRDPASWKQILTPAGLETQQRSIVGPGEIAVGGRPRKGGVKQHSVLQGTGVRAWPWPWAEPHDTSEGQSRTHGFEIG